MIMINTDRLWCLSLRFFCSIQLLCLSPLWLLWFMVTSTLEFHIHLRDLFLACGGSHWAFYTPGCFLLVRTFVFVSCGFMESEQLHFHFKDLFFALCGGSLWALYTPNFCFFVLAVLSSSAWFCGSDGAKRGLYTALDSAVIPPVMLFPSCQYPCSQTLLLTAIRNVSAGHSLGAFFFSSRPNKASTAGMSAGNRKIRCALLYAVDFCCTHSVCCGFLLALLFVVR